MTVFIGNQEKPSKAVKAQSKARSASTAKKGTATRNRSRKTAQKG